MKNIIAPYIPIIIAYFIIFLIIGVNKSWKVKSFDAKTFYASITASILLSLTTSIFIKNQRKENYYDKY